MRYRLIVNMRENDDHQQHEMVLGQENQFSAEIDHMATCVLDDIVPRTPGEEGLADQVVIEALYESAATGLPVKLPRVKGLDVTRGPLPAS